MKIKEKQVFNLMDTNGRRNDVIDALQGYITILKEVLNNDEWGNVPNSLSQFNFYKNAIELSPDVFKQHEPYDNLINDLKNNPDLYNAVLKNDVFFIQDNAEKYGDIINKFDKGIEDRARHYTSNLVKLGFVDSNRNISKVGELLLEPSKLKRDKFEKILPIDNLNIIYLRQLLKLRLFDESEQYYYSPFLFALYLLLNQDRINENEFFELIQGTNPYNRIENIDSYIDNYEVGKVVNDLEVTIPLGIDTEKILDFSVFKEHFKNQKSQNQINIYWQFYNKLYEFNNERNQNNLNKMLCYYEENDETLKKAFGFGKNIFSNRRGNRPEVNEFIDNNLELFSTNINKKIYENFIKSKQLDSIHEYSDTTKRIFKATGIISFDNGYVELAYKELIKVALKDISVKEKIWNNIQEEENLYYESYENYEKSIDSYYCSSFSICQILNLKNEEEEKLLNNIKNEFNNENINNIPDIIKNKRKKEFAKYIESKYPLEQTITLLQLFKDRNNDNQIKELVSSDATIPTIYEFVVGIAWYYFSNKRIDLLESYNLTLSADFEPLTHAGGGQGDIVIYEDDKVIMLEATLMNANAQKRGEWEPVLRHSINLKIEEERAEHNRNVITFFIADSFDHNTINIWKAIASVPLESSIHRDVYTDNVIIMPVNNEELIKLLYKSDKYDEIIEKVRDIFNTEKTTFDTEWRNKFVNQIL